MAKHFLVTGGAGFLGINLIRLLLKEGHTVSSLDIAPVPDSDVADRISDIQGDIRNKADVEAAMDGVDIVVHAAAALPLYSREDIFSTDVEGTRNILHAAHQEKVDRAVFISSTAVYGVPDHHPLKEDDRLEGVGPYGEAKIQAEAVCEEFRQQGLCVSIIRPKTFIGPERLGVFALLYDWAADGRNFPIIGKGENRYQLLAVEDLCRAILLAGQAPPEIANDTFNIGAKHFETFREDLQSVLDAAGHGKRIIPFPAGPAIFALRILEKLNLSPLYQWVYDTVTHDSFVSIQKAEELLNYRPQYSNRDALLRNFDWYCRHRTEFAQATGISHRVPWKQGALGLIKHLF